MARRHVLLGGAVVMAVAASLIAWSPWASRSGEGGNGFAVAAARARTLAAHASPAAVVPAGPVSGWIATLKSPVGYSASPGGPVIATLPALDPFGAPNTLAVIGRPDPSGWAQVELPIRPNGSTGWVSTAGVTLTWTSYEVQVSLAARTVTVLQAGQPVLTLPAAIGAPRTPTPPGRTYLWELIRPDNPRGAYGPYILGLAMFSDTYSVFNGGDAQIGIHGNDDLSSVGRPVSHGCIRLANDAITNLAGMLPLGTPVTIS
ncbi:MAG: L,D-transpeptidase [Acidimicrobiales bacterium]